MTLLQQIQEDAINPDFDLSCLLRKCRILASRLKNEEFKDWILNELNGYPVDSLPPDYRIFNCESYGNFIGPGYAEIRNQPIPPLLINKKYRDTLETLHFIHGVTELKAIINGADDIVLNASWPNDLICVMNADFYDLMKLTDAWRSISVHRISGILDTIRNRILEFVIQIEEQDPNAGESTGEPLINPEKITDIYYNCIIIDGDNTGNIVTGENSGNLASGNIENNIDSFSDLIEFLKGHGIKDNDIVTLPPSIDKIEDGINKIKDWLQDIKNKAINGLIDISIKNFNKYIEPTIFMFYGIELLH